LLRQIRQKSRHASSCTIGPVEIKCFLRCDTDSSGAPFLNIGINEKGGLRAAFLISELLTS
jgi:hypothetical protein